MRLKSILLALLFGFFVLFVFPALAIKINNLLSLPVFDHLVLDITGVVLILGGLSIWLSSIFLFKVVGRGTPVPIEPPTTLVQSGPYRFTRNPMYLGLFSLILGGGLIFGHLLLILHSVVFLIFIHFYVVIVEEPNLKEKFGNKYIEYTKLVPRWIPKVRTDESTP